MSDTSKLVTLTDNADTIVLFPGTYNEIKLHKDEDITINLSSDLWTILTKYATCEDIENTIGKPIETIAKECYQGKYLSEKERKKVYREETISKYKRLACEICKSMYPDKKLKTQDYRHIAQKFIASNKTTDAKSEIKSKMSAIINEYLSE